MHGLSNEILREALEGKTVLVTGGTGSFGHTVAAELLSYDSQKIIIYSRDEKKQDDMRNEFNNPKITFIIGDVRDEQSVMRAIEGLITSFTLQHSNSPQL